MAAADVYCQPNVAPEPFGISYVEALASGLPVVTSNFGGGAEIVTPQCGLLAPAEDDAAVAGALRVLLAGNGKLQALSQAAPPRAVELCDPARQIARQAVALIGGDIGERLSYGMASSDKLKPVDSTAPRTNNILGR